jgi:hypothetical protein
VKRRRLNRSALRRLLISASLALLALAGLAVCLWIDNALSRGITYRPQTLAPTPHGDVPRGGVNSFNLHLEPDPAVVSRTLELAHTLGARTVRMQLPWEDVEIAGKGDFRDSRHDLDGDGQIDTISAWEKYDRIVNTAASLGLELILRIDRPPLWAREQAAATPEFQQGLAEDGNSTGPPDSYEDYGEFVGAVAGRYRGKVRYLQLWNEPNLKVEWNWQQPDPAQFVGLLRAGYTAAKRANPEAVILFPSLAPTDGLDLSAPISDLDFLDGVYQAGGAEYFDVMSAQLYGLGQPPSEHRYVRWRGDWRRPLDTRTDVSRIVLLREIMERHDDAGKAVFIAEYGWNSAPETIPPERRNTWGEPISEEQKGRYIVELMERARREWPWVGSMQIWMLRYGGATPPNPEDPTPYFALVDREFNETPAFAIVRDYLNAPAVAGPGSFSWAHPAVEQIPGGWRLRFEGERLELVGGLAGAMDRVTLDGQPALLSRDGTPDGRALWTLVPEQRVAAGDYPLASGLHTLEIVAPNAEPPDSFSVSRRPPAVSWLLPPAMVLLLLLLAAALSTAVHALFGLLDNQPQFGADERK